MLVFDHDGTGDISLTEFVARDSLCDTIVAQLNPHFNEEDAPASPLTYGSYGSYQAPTSHGSSGNHAAVQQPPQYASPPPYMPSQQHTVQIQCGNCRAMVSVICPPGNY